METMDDNPDNLAFDPQAKDLLDNEPNAWLEIPAYDAHPLTSEHQGFAKPIIGWSRWEAWAPDVVSMITTARSILKQSVADVSVVPRLVNEFMQGCTSADGEILPPEMQRYSVPQREAFLYGAFIFSLGRLAEGSWQSHSEADEIQHRLEWLAHAAADLAHWASGAADRLLDQSSSEARIAIQRVQSRKQGMFAQWGLQGAEAKHRDTSKLKAWALERSASLRGSDVEIARALVGLIPAHLAGVSTNPQRLIYDALRASRKNRA